ncbi:MAG: hypothetical protein AB1465_04925 [Patescibacteria group bacterium]
MSEKPKPDYDQGIKFTKDGLPKCPECGEVGSGRGCRNCFHSRYEEPIYPPGIENLKVRKGRAVKKDQGKKIELSPEGYPKCPECGKTDNSSCPNSFHSQFEEPLYPEKH